MIRIKYQDVEFIYERLQEMDVEVELEAPMLVEGMSMRFFVTDPTGGGSQTFFAQTAAKLALAMQENWEDAEFVGGLISNHMKIRVDTTGSNNHLIRFSGTEII